MSKVQEKNDVISLRRKGYTYREIMKVVPNVAKSTLSKWCNSIELTPAQYLKLKENMETGRDRGLFNTIVRNRENRGKRDELIRRAAREEFKTYNKDPFFAFGVALYWAEGSKKSRRFQFTNSDSRLINAMVRWTNKYIRTPKKDLIFRLYLHKVYEAEDPEGFWSRAIGVPRESFLRSVYKSTTHGAKKNPNYKGCVRFDARRVAPWIMIDEWQNCFAESLHL